MNWDIYFLKIAKTVSEKSSCMSRKIGAVIVKDKAIISTGYNGSPRGVSHCNERDTSFYKGLDGKEEKDYMGRTHIDWKKYNNCPRREHKYKSGKGLHLCQAGHAERNAIVQAARSGVSTNNATLYVYSTQICKDCMIEIINSGIKKIVSLYGEKDYDKYARVLSNEAGIEWIVIDKEKLPK